MNSTDLKSLSKTSTLIDAKGAEGPIPVMKLKSALAKANNKSVFGVLGTDPLAQANLRDFCQSTRNEYLGVEHFDDHDIHYVQKRTVECQRCSNIRYITLGLVAIGTLAYTAPQVLTSNPSGFVTVLFAASLASLPAAVFNNLRLLKQFIKKSNAPATLKAAE